MGIAKIPIIDMAIDNEAALGLTYNPEYQKCSKHISIKCYFIHR